MSLVEKWVKTEDLILSEVSKAQKDTYHVRNFLKGNLNGK
jgi:hypothetical protein